MLILCHLSSPPPAKNDTDEATAPQHRTCSTVPSWQSCFMGCVLAGEAERIEQCFREAAQYPPGVTWSLRLTIIEDINP